MTTKNCTACGATYRRTKESIAEWEARRFCSRVCSNRAPRNFDERAALLAKVDTTDPLRCWNWQGCRKERGYGHTGRGYAHRRSYELFKGPIPKGRSVLHRCDNPPCINPDHLRVGTQADNIADMVGKGRGWWQTWKRPRQLEPEQLQ